MRAAIVSDIHGNRQAFEAVLDAVEASDCDELWCLGDLVGYGADPDACVQLAREHAAVCLAGNHDMGVRGDLPLEEFSRGAALAAKWTQDTITRETREYLEGLDPLDLDEQVGLYHASPRDPVWEYVLSALQADLCLDAQNHRVCLIGHSHVALSFSRLRGEAATGQTRTDDEELELDSGEWLVNPGSVGQPRDGDPRAAWLELDLDGWTAVYRRVEYDIDGAAAAIRAARLPIRWPSGWPTVNEPPAGSRDVAACHGANVMPTGAVSKVTGGCANSSGRSWQAGWASPSPVALLAAVAAPDSCRAIKRTHFTTDWDRSQARYRRASAEPCSQPLSS